jgi:hypothetical protein
MRALLIAALILVPTPAMAQVPARSAAAAAPAGKCERLAREWKGIEYRMADRHADEIGDNSAPRATLRAMEESNNLAEASMILSFMRDGRCALPSHPPSYISYFGAALECHTAILGGAKADDAKCDREKWTRVGD